MTSRKRSPLEVDSPWLTAEEAAAYARMNVDAIKAACRRGELVASKPSRRWLIERRHLDAFIRGERVSA